MTEKEKSPSGSGEEEKKSLPFSAIALIVVIVAVIAIFVFNLRDKIFGLGANNSLVPQGSQDDGVWRYEQTDPWGESYDERARNGQNGDPAEDELPSDNPSFESEGGVDQGSN
jgi:hypothetical protein